MATFNCPLQMKISTSQFRFEKLIKNRSLDSCYIQVKMDSVELYCRPCNQYCVFRAPNNLLSLVYPENSTSIHKLFFLSFNFAIEYRLFYTRKL